MFSLTWCVAIATYTVHSVAHQNEKLDIKCFFVHYAGEDIHVAGKEIPSYSLALTEAC